MTMPTDPDVTTSAPRPTVADQPPCMCRLCAPATTLDDVRACVAAAELAAAASPPGEHDLASLYAVAGYTRSMCDEIERLRARPAVDRADITAALETFRLAALAEHAASTDRGESIGAVRAVVVTLQDARDAVFAVATTPPAIPAALAALLREQSEAWAAIDTAPAPDYQSACERSQDADAALREWTRAHAGAVASTPAAACICRRDDEGEWLPGSEDCPRWGLDDEHPLTEGSTHAGATPAPLTDDELASMWRRQIGTSPSPNGMTIMRAIRDHAGGGR